MSISMNKAKTTAYVVKATDKNGDVKANYSFASLKEAMKFEIAMRNLPYKTSMHRKSI